KSADFERIGRVHGAESGRERALLEACSCDLSRAETNDGEPEPERRTEAARNAHDFQHRTEIDGVSEPSVRARAYEVSLRNARVVELNRPMLAEVSERGPTESEPGEVDGSADTSRRDGR